LKTAYFIELIYS